MASICYVNSTMANLLDIDLLRAFVAVVETGSFSRAGERIGRSQSAVSMQIKRLEQSIGKRLLHRGTKAVALNSVGADFLVHARQILKLSDEAWTSVTRPEETGCVRLGVPDDYAAFLLPPALEQFSAEHPLVTVELICEPSLSLTKAIADGKIDLAIVTRVEEQPVEVIRKEPFVWVASPTHVAWKSDPVPVALFAPGSAARTNVIRALSENGYTYRNAYSSASLLGLVAVVQAGLAVAGLAKCSVPPSLCIIGVNEGLPPLNDLEVSILRKSGKSDSATDCLYNFLYRSLTDCR
ncbi:LysR substrate-binding domain-containing protein [Serratia marcescens]|uniref:LysR substrate-binding domain-containing protein n=1 Tax=Serratia marcescens TaxID=615 RepID=UPI003D6E4453